VIASIATFTTIHRQSPRNAIGTTPARTSHAIATIHPVTATISPASQSAGPATSPMLVTPP
jgi:hypothetical protein